MGSSNGHANGDAMLRPSSTNGAIRAVASEPRTSKAKAAEQDVQPQANPLSTDPSGIASNIKYHADFTPSFSPYKFELKQAYVATAESLRDTLVQRWNQTFKHFSQENSKTIHYLSMEFLQGRALLNAVGNLELKDEYSEALHKLGHDLEAVAEQEPDAALGNGGLGRLASCFLDSLATLNYPAWGYGLRYKYGLFQQSITKDGQKEQCEKWLEMGYPWEIPRNDISYPIKFFGKVVDLHDGKKEWVGGENVRAFAYDVPIPGFRTKNTISLRLWSTRVAAEDFDLASFNAGNYSKAAEAHANAERICYVLYPGDETEEGKLLRLKQQYTLCSASIQDIIVRFKERSGGEINWDAFPSKVAIQMNDTHPTLCVPELLRILIDEEGLAWDQAWKITQATVAYTNHTVLPEALEKWPLIAFEKLLPRHVQIIGTIDEQFMNMVASKVDKSELEAKIASMRILENIDLPASIQSLLPPKPVKEKAKKAPKAAAKGDVAEEEAVEEEDEEEEAVPQKPAATVRMANLCVIAGHKVNGVAAIHSQIVIDEVFNDFYKLWPDKFQNKTNGVTPRRWLSFCNPELSSVITKWLGSEEWVLDTKQLAGLRNFADNKDLQKEWTEAKMARKQKLAAYILAKTGYTINPNALFDIQVKRIHEYKRQLLNIMGVIYRYKKMKEMSDKERAAKYVPRVVMFGGKAFATYWQAKRIVKLITDVAAVVNNDPEIGDLLKVIMVPDYNVSVAEVLIPASELSQHISTAGMEASGTSNMKFSFNGCVLIGTLDGANVEIRQEVGEDNFFLFGAYAHEIAGLRADRAAGKFKPDPRFDEVKNFIRSGAFGDYDYSELLGSLEGDTGYGRGDYFLVGHDFPSYIECQDKVDEAYRDQQNWVKMSIMNTAGSYTFSSDRTIHEYAKDIWGITPSPLE
jgi:starch phosphorylase